MSAEPILLVRDLHKTFHRETGEVVQALDGVSLSAAEGTLTALVGPDGAGKTTLIRLAAGLLNADSGELRLLGLDVATHAAEIQSRIGYMPQRFGLYEDLTVQENLNLYADLHGVDAATRGERYPQLMSMTALGPFTRRLAGRLSGGMKQKLGLACTLISSPEFLLLDEPTVGVDPLSRRELWEIILQLVHERGLTVLVSTSYLDEAQRCGHAIVMHQGKILAEGRPDEVSQLAAGHTFLVDPPAGQTARGLQARLLDDSRVIDAVPEGGHVRLVWSADRVDAAGSLARATVEPTEPRFEDGFMVLLRRSEGNRGQGPGARDQEAGGSRQEAGGSRQEAGSGRQEAGSGRQEALSELPTASRQLPTVVEVHDLVRRFGTFVAVDHINFEVHRGEIFGLLGPNGAGKTTTFRMLCGLLAATGGTLHVAGVDVRRARASARQRIGYVAQKFSLYGQISTIDNLEFFASAYGLRGRRKRERIEWALRQFELAQFARLPSRQLPGGYKQRLAMAAALLHEPEILFLDEPTSGADPLARREFWQRITHLAADGVTAIVTTHFMEEAEYCDRIAILDSGRILAQGSPAEVRRLARPQPGHEPTMEDAFIAVVEDARKSEAQVNARAGGAA